MEKLKLIYQLLSKPVSVVCLANTWLHILSLVRFQHCSLLFNDLKCFLPAPKGQQIYNPFEACGAAIFPFTVSPPPVAKGTFKVTNSISSSYTFLFLKQSDNRLFVLIYPCNVLSNEFLEWPDSVSLFICASFFGGGERDARGDLAYRLHLFILK